MLASHDVIHIVIILPYHRQNNIHIPLSNQCVCVCPNREISRQKRQNMRQREIFKRTNQRMSVACSDDAYWPVLFQRYVTSILGITVPWWSLRDLLVFSVRKLAFKRLSYEELDRKRRASIYSLIIPRGASIHLFIYRHGQTIAVSAFMHRRSIKTNLAACTAPDSPSKTIITCRVERIDGMREGCSQYYIQWQSCIENSVCLFSIACRDAGPGLELK